MAQFYATIKGSRGSATRTGSPKSGMKASVQSYKGSVIVEMLGFDEDGEPIIRLDTNKNSSSACGDGEHVFLGNLSDLRAMIWLNKLIKNGTLKVQRAEEEKG